MGARRYSTEQIIVKLREAFVELYFGIESEPGPGLLDTEGSGLAEEVDAPETADWSEVRSLEVTDREIHPELLEECGIRVLPDQGSHGTLAVLDQPAG